MNENKGFDPVEAVILVIGVMLVGGCTLLGVLFVLAGPRGMM